MTHDVLYHCIGNQTPQDYLVNAILAGSLPWFGNVTEAVNATSQALIARTNSQTTTTNVGGGTVPPSSSSVPIETKIPPSSVISVPIPQPSPETKTIAQLVAAASDGLGLGGLSIGDDDSSDDDDFIGELEQFVKAERVGDIKCASCGKMINKQMAVTCIVCKKIYYCDAQCRANHVGKHSSACTSYTVTESMLAASAEFDTF